MPKTFTEYYADHDFKKRHMNYLKEKIKCECGRSVSRVNMIRHCTTPIHKNSMMKITAETDVHTITTEIERLNLILQNKKI